MASIVRIGVARFVSATSLPATSRLQISVRNISSKSLRALNKGPPKPKPWNYEDRSFTLLNYFYDRTSKRFDENSKIIVVEGPIAAGKSKLAKQLAEELDMLYLPEANLDMEYTNGYGYNMKCLDEQLPEACRSFDVNNFLLNPKHRLAASFQLRQYQIKFSQYIDALAHVFSTGQGVVLDRCVYSDFVFLETMCNGGYVSKGARNVYYDMRKNSISELLRPHLVIYLDVPVEKIMENVKSRNICYEVNSPVLDKQYLSYMEKCYKQEYLQTINEHAELLVYDWSDEGEVEVVVEDIERIDFNKYEPHDKKMSDWVFHLEEDYAVMRRQFADRKPFLLTFFNVPHYEVPELVNEAEDVKAARDIWYSAPGMQYTKGYNKSMGDSGLLFKTKLVRRPTLPRMERQIPT